MIKIHFHLSSVLVTWSGLIGVIITIVLLGCKVAGFDGWIDSDFKGRIMVEEFVNCPLVLWLEMVEKLLVIDSEVIVWITVFDEGLRDSILFIELDDIDIMMLLCIEVGFTSSLIDEEKLDSKWWLDEWVGELDSILIDVLTCSVVGNIGEVLGEDIDEVSKISEDDTEVSSVIGDDVDSPMKEVDEEISLEDIVLYEVVRWEVSYVRDTGDGDIDVVASNEEEDLIDVASVDINDDIDDDWDTAMLELIDDFVEFSEME